MILSSLGPVDSEPPEDRKAVRGEAARHRKGNGQHGNASEWSGRAVDRRRDRPKRRGKRFGVPVRGGKAEGGRQEERNIGNAAAPITKRTTEYEIEQSVAPL